MSLAMVEKAIGFCNCKFDFCMAFIPDSGSPTHIEPKNLVMDEFDRQAELKPEGFPLLNTSLERSTSVAELEKHEKLQTLFKVCLSSSFPLGLSCG